MEENLFSPKEGGGHGGTMGHTVVVTYKFTLINSDIMRLSEEFYVSTLEEARDHAMEHFHKKFRFDIYQFTNVEIIDIRWRRDSKAQYCARCGQMFPMIHKSIHEDSRYYDRYICNNCDWYE